MPAPADSRPSPAAPEPGGAVLRPATAADAEFVFRLYAGTREAEMKLTGWPAARQESFLRSQFAARRAHYASAFPAVRQSIVLLRGRPAGVLMVDRTAQEIRIVDLALVPAHRGRGLGGRLLRALCDEARSAGKPLRLQVIKTNPARRLYDRLGFSPTAENGYYVQMEWRAD